MKNNNYNLSKIESVITNERNKIGEEFKSLFLNDLNKLVGEYFEIDSDPVIDVVKQNNLLQITINFSSKGIKFFKSINI